MFAPVLVPSILKYLKNLNIKCCINKFCKFWKFLAPSIIFSLVLCSCSQNPALVEYKNDTPHRGRNTNNKPAPHKDETIYSDILHPISDDKQIAPQAAPNNDVTEESVPPPIMVSEEKNTSNKLDMPLYKPDISVVRDEVIHTKRGHGLIMPAQGRVLSPFGRVNNRFNDGTLLGLDENQRIIAAADGTVVYVGQELREYGNMVIIEHSGDVITSYAQVKSVNVKVGEKIKKGQLIGNAGKIKDVSPRLLFSVRVNGAAVDPIKYVSE